MVAIPPAEEAADPQLVPPRPSSGRFVSGQSGNPSGRPAGSRNRTTQLCADLLGESAEAIIAKVIELAKEGDSVCVRLALDRIIPARAARDRSVQLQVGALASLADLVDVTASVIGAAATGNISLSEAREFLALVEVQRKVLETYDVGLRVELLEQRLGIDDGPRTVGFAPPGGPEADMGARVRRLNREGK